MTSNYLFACWWSFNNSWQNINIQMNFLFFLTVYFFCSLHHYPELLLTLVKTFESRFTVVTTWTWELFDDFETFGGVSEEALSLGILDTWVSTWSLMSATECLVPSAPGDGSWKRRCYKYYSYVLFPTLTLFRSGCSDSEQKYCQNKAKMEGQYLIWWFNFLRKANTDL